ncbi:helix-turn-helix domain-containing protein [Amycolatopsis tucumanensis]|uniref:Helix-turn-helix domain-containing protein n=1 Tax=Amycolatopsis tucumanensis TaxID=401106 RepID=A0ABP7JPN1_9PSEU
MTTTTNPGTSATNGPGPEHRGTTPAPPDASATAEPLLYTPAQAAEKLAVPESWLRRKAGLRVIPCTFLGKHLRFSEADLRAIVVNGSRPTGAQRRRTRRKRTRSL